MRDWIYGALLVIFAAVMVLGAAHGHATPEDRALALGSRIMCPVCEGSSIADSRSEVAVGMMDKVRELVAQGETDDEILSYFAVRYSESIILDPPFRGRTLVIWLLPAAAVLAGAWLVLRRRRRDAVPAPVGGGRGS